MPTQMLTVAAPAKSVQEFAEDVRWGLSQPGQKRLSCKYLYDSLGSTLFEAICLLPEYGLTRAEERIFTAHANEIASAIPCPTSVVELGSGTGKKTRAILEALHRRGQSIIPYRPIDISAAALETCRQQLQDLSFIDFVALENEYLNGLLEVAADRRNCSHLTVMFLGSTIGNFNCDETADFLKKTRAMLQPGDVLLLATDLVKRTEILLAAYDDSLGITAAFNLNLLARANRELGADFDLDQFEHVALFDQTISSIEIYLRSRIDQTIHVPGAGISVQMHEGETIWTETSHKFSFTELSRLAARSGFRPRHQWVDGAWCFAENLWVAA